MKRQFKKRQERGLRGRKFLKIAGIAVGAAILFTFPGPSKSEAEPVKVGFLYPLSGSIAATGQRIRDAVKLATEHINTQGGIKSLGGAKLEVIYADNQSKEEVEKTEAERLIDRGVVAINGSYASFLSMVGSAVAERRQVPFVTGSIADPLVERGFKYIFQISPRAHMFGETQVKGVLAMAKEVGGPMPKRAAVVFNNTDYGVATAKGLRDTVKETGLELAMYEPYPLGLPDASPLVTKIKGVKPDVIFPVSYIEEATLLLKESERQKVAPLIVGGGAGYLLPDFYEAAGWRVATVMSVGSWNWDINYPVVLEVAKEYEQKYGRFIFEHAGEAYALQWLIKEALEQAASRDPKKIRDTLAKIRVVPPHPAAIMAGGALEFDEKGWNYHVYPVLVQWQNGEGMKPRTVYPAVEARRKPIYPVPSWEKRKP